MRSRSLTGAAVFLFIFGCTHHAILVDKDRVTLSLKAPGAKSVQFASSLDSYSVHEAKRDAESNWVVQLPSETQFSYFYLVDGKFFLPECTYRETDDFGSQNCVYVPGM